MARTPKFEGSELSEGHGPSKFTTETQKNVAETLAGGLLDEFVAHLFNRGDHKIVPHSELLEPSALHYAALLTTKGGQIEPGTYTVDPEAQHMSFENMVLFSPEVSSSFVDAPITEVLDRFLKIYQSTHTFPGIEYAKYLHEHPEQIPEMLKDGQLYFFPGSLVHNRGDWSMVWGYWTGSTWQFGSRWVKDAWISDYHLTLFEKPSKKRGVDEVEK